MQDRPNVVTMVAKAGLGEIIPSQTIPPKPSVYCIDSFICILNLFGGSTSLTATAFGGGDATASSLGGGAGGTTAPYKNGCYTIKSISKRY